jgi:hypothetical protein
MVSKNWKLFVARLSGLWLHEILLDHPKKKIFPAKTKKLRERMGRTPYPCYKNFILGLRPCGNQLPCSWVIVELLPRFWVKNYKQSYLKPFCGLQYSAGLLYVVSWPSLALVILCELCSWTNILGGHGWHNILK